MREPAKPIDEPLQQLAQKWAEHKITLKDVRGYTDREMYAIARTAYVYFYQGRVEDARVLFRGLSAVNPADPYFARALAVVEFAGGNSEAALAAWDVSIELAPDDPSAWVGRAEVEIASGDKVKAAEDLHRARALAPPHHPLKPKIDALLQTVTRR
jgi:tetratricopeptide (TPR) repeat protein